MCQWFLGMLLRFIVDISANREECSRENLKKLRSLPVVI